VRKGGFWTLTVPGLGEVELVARRMTPLRLEAGVTVDGGKVRIAVRE
jgi:hypothetical protein